MLASVCWLMVCAQCVDIYVPRGCFQAPLRNQQKILLKRIHIKNKMLIVTVVMLEHPLLEDLQPYVEVKSNALSRQCFKEIPLLDYVREGHFKYEAYSGISTPHLYRFQYDLRNIPICTASVAYKLRIGTLYKAKLEVAHTTDFPEYNFNVDRFDWVEPINFVNDSFLLSHEEVKLDKVAFERDTNRIKLTVVVQNFSYWKEILLMVLREDGSRLEVVHATHERTSDDWRFDWFVAYVTVNASLAVEHIRIERIYYKSHRDGRYFQASDDNFGVGYSIFASNDRFNALRFLPATDWVINRHGDGTYFESPYYTTIFNTDVFKLQKEIFASPSFLKVQRLSFLTRLQQQMPQSILKPPSNHTDLRGDRSTAPVGSGSNRCTHRRFKSVTFAALNGCSTYNAAQQFGSHCEKLDVCQTLCSAVDHENATKHEAPRENTEDPNKDFFLI